MLSPSKEFPIVDPYGPLCEVDVYVKAREIAEAEGFSAGWEVYGEHTPFRQSMVYKGIGMGVD